MDVAQLKQKAAERAVDFVESGMVVGLGHGSTAIFAVRRIARLLQSGQLADILGVPCSIHVEEEARELGIPLTTLDDHPIIDLTIDGADEVDPAWLRGLRRIGVTAGASTPDEAIEAVIRRLEDCGGVITA